MWKIDKGSRSGTTTESYSDALNWPVAELARKTMLLKNTHGDNSLKYRLFGYVAEEGIAAEIVAETILDSGQVAEFHYDRQWHNFVLQIANGSGTATYAIDYEGQGA